MIYQNKSRMPQRLNDPQNKKLKCQIPYPILSKLKDEMSNSVIGQEKVIERILMVLLADGNLLLEGLPG